MNPQKAFCFHRPVNMASFFLYIAFFAGAKLVASDGVADLIASTCNHTQYYDVCMSSLRSRPKNSHSHSHKADDLHALAVIAMQASIAHAKVTIAYAKALRKLGSGGGNDVVYASRCLGDCVEEYREALGDLHQSTAALKNRSYDTVNVLVSGAMTNSDTCESGFGDRPGVQSPLTERNEYFFKLCSNTIAITNLLAV